MKTYSYSQLKETEDKKWWIQRIMEGKWDWYSPLDKFWALPLLSIDDDPADVWEVWTIYNYDADWIAPIIYLSSWLIWSDVNDQIIRITWLDINWNEVNQDITLDWQNNVELDVPLWRVYRMINISNTSFVWIVYCHLDANPTNWVPTIPLTRAIIDNDYSEPHNQTLMALFTIPKWKVWFLYRWELWLKMSWWPSDVVEYCHFHYQSRRVWGVFTVKKAIDCIVWGSSIYKDERSFPDIIPALTDIRITAIEVSASMWVWATFDILLVDEDKFSEDYLQNIWQPSSVI